MCLVCDADSAQLEQTVYLDCGHCPHVRALPAELPNLKVLAIDHTGITRVPDYPSLEALYCFHSSVAELGDLPKLRRLVANGSQIAALRDDYFRLETANLADTKLRCIPGGLVNLRWLAADHTRISEIPPRLISLEWLSIRGTDVAQLPAEMPSMVYLNCSDTKISSIDEDECPMLRKLVCQNCGIDPFGFTGAMNVST